MALGAIRLALSTTWHVFPIEIYFVRDDALERLLGYHGLRYYLVNAWYVSFRIWRVEVSEARPHGIRYSFTLHDELSARLLGFDNAHGVPKQMAHDHRHSFRRTKQIVEDWFVSADKLLSDFMTAVGEACRSENVEFLFVEKERELGEDVGD
jgi:integrase